MYQYLKVSTRDPLVLYASTGTGTIWVVVLASKHWDRYDLARPYQYFFKSLVHQVKFPTFYAANLVLLSATNTSIFEESFFSSAGDTLYSRRFRLSESADLLEAVSIMRNVINSRNKADSDRVKAMKVSPSTKINKGNTLTGSFTSSAAAIDLTSA